MPVRGKSWVCWWAGPCKISAVFRLSFLNCCSVLRLYKLLCLNHRRNDSRGTCLPLTLCVFGPDPTDSCLDRMHKTMERHFLACEQGKISDNHQFFGTVLECKHITSLAGVYITQVA